MSLPQLAELIISTAAEPSNMLPPLIVWVLSADVFSSEGSLGIREIHQGSREGKAKPHYGPIVSIPAA
ncbi:hypothetical protein JOF34_000520 [Microbacterium amylolyticum]|uniref:Uncharacterized protein n=1 Tax=Microbacterium amylolyticum TaxID=936337 RepID=A0ABS4ZF84_9MICO|nr:hypothetical protein [Microbacterium amylolyticum]